MDNKDTVISEHKESVRRNRMSHSSLWKWSTLVLVILLLLTWYANGLPTWSGDQGKDAAAEKAVSFINENLLAGFATATVTSVEQDGDVYTIMVDITSIMSNVTQNATLYMTKDGSLLFPTAIDISKYMLPNTENPITNTSFQAAADPVLGNPNASVTIVEYGDFECPICGQVYPTITALLEEYPDQVKLIFQNFPIENKHKYAQKAAEAAECANIQGKFEVYYNILFQNQDALEVDDLKQYAVGLGLETQAFDDCLDSGAMAEEVALDKSEGIAIGLQGTPTFYITGPNSVTAETVLGNEPITVFEAIIDAQLTETPLTENETI